jgi:hypothetical protein
MDSEHGRKVPEGQDEPAYTVLCMHEHPKIVEAKPGRSFGKISPVLYEAWTELSDAVQKVFSAPRLDRQSPGRDPTPAHFLAFFSVFDIICRRVETFIHC